MSAGYHNRPRPGEMYDLFQMAAETHDLLSKISDIRICLLVMVGVLACALIAQILTLLLLIVRIRPFAATYSSMHPAPSTAATTPKSVTGTHHNHHNAATAGLPRQRSLSADSTAGGFYANAPATTTGQLNHHVYHAPPTRQQHHTHTTATHTPDDVLSPTKKSTSLAPPPHAKASSDVSLSGRMGRRNRQVMRRTFAQTTTNQDPEHAAEELQTLTLDSVTNDHGF